MFTTLVSRMFTKAEEPKYKVIKTTEGFEEREYEPCMWAVTDSTAEASSFRRLLNYISGTNKEGVSMSMAAPVMVFHQPGEDGDWKSFKKDNKIGFMVPVDNREKPPTPNDDTPITFRETPTTRVYVRKYGGFSNDETALAEVAKLREALGTEHKYKDGLCYFCGYDSPMTLIGRRNEIWFLKESGDSN